MSQARDCPRRARSKADLTKVPKGSGADGADGSFCVGFSRPCPWSHYAGSRGFSLWSADGKHMEADVALAGSYRHTRFALT